jgi:hypothetical protein
MAAITRNPANRDILQTTKFRLNFTRLPGITYFCQTATLPGISLTEIPRNTPFVDLYVPGEKAIYDVFNATFIIAEDLDDWKQIHDWIRGMTFPKDFSEYRDLAKQSNESYYKAQNKVPVQYADGLMTIYSNKNNPSVRVKFKDMFPTQLGGIQFSSLDSAENIPTADVSFRYSYYDIEKL